MCTRNCVGRIFPIIESGNFGSKNPFQLGQTKWDGVTFIFSIYRKCYIISKKLASMRHDRKSPTKYRAPKMPVLKFSIYRATYYVHFLLSQNAQTIFVCFLLLLYCISLLLLFIHSFKSVLFGISIVNDDDDLISFVLLSNFFCL